MRTCSACPSQWEGRTDDERLIYVRYRWGYLTISISKPNSRDISDAVNGEPVFDLKHGDDLSGYMEYEELKKLTQHLIEWPYEP